MSIQGYNSQTTGPLWSGPLVGEVGEQDAFIWVQARDTSPLTLAIVRPAGAPTTLTAIPTTDDYYCALFHVTGLAPGTTYGYEISSRHGKTVRYQFRTAPTPQARQCRVAFGSCFLYYKNEDLPSEGEGSFPPTPHIFDTVRTYQPDLFVMAGDNCYYGSFNGQSDFVDEDHKMLVQLAHRNNPSLSRLVNCTATLGIWDNHDFGEGQKNASGIFMPANALNTPPNQIKDSFNVFKRMWAQRRFGLPAGALFPKEVKGIFSSVRYGPVEIFLLDGRFYREPPQQLLGPKQIAWLKSRLAASSAPVKLIVSGSVVLPKFVFIDDGPFYWEGWQKDARQELGELLGHIESNDIRGVIFLSGDLHLGCILHQRARRLGGGKRGPEFYEIVASPLRNNVWTTRVHTKSGQPYYDATLVSEALHNNFGLIDIDLDRVGNEITLRLKDTQGRDLISRSVALADLRVRPQIDKLTALVWPNGKAYFFSGNGYVAYLVDPNNEGAIAGYPKYTDLNWLGWPAHWSEGIDAGLVWNASYAYFFRGAEYIRYNIPEDRVDPGYPKPIAGNWPGLAEAFPQGVDSAIDWGNGYVYFFQGNSYVRYRKDPGQEGVEAGYPRAIAGNWPGLDRLT